MLKLTNDVLDYSKMESDRVHVILEPFDLMKEIKNTVHNYEQMIRKPVAMKLEIDSLTPQWVKGDRLRFHQILSNLLDNAVKFTPTGNITVYVKSATVKIEVGKSFKLLVAVQDTGIGITKEDLSRLFAPFSQLDAFATKRYKGTGLGLAISRKLVHLMDGDISAESEVGKGSTFKFSVSMLLMEQPKEEDTIRKALVTSVQTAASQFIEGDVDMSVLKKPSEDVSMLNSGG